MARPKKNIRLEHTVGVRLNGKDYAEAQSRSKVCGLPLSAWMREAALGRRLTPARPAVNQEVWGMLGKMMSGIALLKEHTGKKPEVFDMLLNYVSTIREKLSQ
ncbi:hypothetical protein [Desulfovibrio aminophilus]|uniref:plasmid mobilization protein n=1 Tax=Desulfovibrio aminophilus TaxID=81425 RepID=UPI003393515D